MPGGRLILKPKRAGETCFTSSPFDFISSMSIGETIAQASCVASVYQGNDGAPLGVVVSATPQNVTQVAVLTTGGVLGCIYQLLCSVVTSLGQTLEQTALLVIVPDSV